MMTPTHALRRSAAVTAAVVAAGLAVALGPIAPAGAHGGDAEMEVVELTRTGDDVAATISLIFVADGHGVPDATVTVVVDDGTPAPMEVGAEEGTYTATISAAPGATLRFTSVDPPASATAEAPAADGPAATEPGATTEPAPEASTTEPSATTEASATTLPGATSVLVESDDGGSDNTVLTLAGITLGIGLVGAVCVVMLMRSRQSDVLGGSDPDGPSDA